MALTSITYDTAPDSGRYNSGVVTKAYDWITDATTVEVAAAASGYQHVVTGGWASGNCSADEYLTFLSGTTEICRFYFNSGEEGYIRLPVPMHTNTGEKLEVQKSGASSSIFLHLDYVTIKPGAYLGVVGV